MQQAAQSLAEILSINREASYRRLRNTTMLSPDELQKVCLHFGVSLDKYIQQQSDNIIFNFSQFTEPVREFEHYLNQLLRNLQLANEIPGASMYYAAQELTPFQYLYFPELSAFKLYVYGLTVWNINGLENRKCSLDLLKPSIQDMAKECVRLYSLIPSTDLWGWDILNHSLNQIEYLAETNRFDPPDMAITVCEQLLLLLERQEEMAKIGRKFFRASTGANTYGSFQLYYNELVHTNNTILLRSPTTKMLFTTFSNPNFLKTSDPVTCDYFENWFERSTRRSTAISIHSEKYRSHFFNRLKKRVNQLQKKIKLTL